MAERLGPRSGLRHQSDRLSRRIHLKTEDDRRGIYGSNGGVCALRGLSANTTNEQWAGRERPPQGLEAFRRRLADPTGIMLR